MIRNCFSKFVSLVVLFGLITGSNTIFAASDNKDMLNEILNRRVLKVGTSVGYAPFEIADVENNYVGFDIDVARFAARHLGVKIEIINVDWAGIIPGLAIGQYDILISAMTATLERAKKIQFTTPYIQIGQKLLINRARHPNVKTYKDLVTKDKLVIATGLTTTGYFLAKNLFPKATFRTMGDPEAAQDVVFGKADLGIFDGPFAQRYLNTYPKKVYSTNDVLSAEPLAIGIRQGLDTVMFLNWMNACIYHLKEVTIVNEELMKEFKLDKSFMGKKFYDALYHKWFVSWLKNK